MFLPINISKNWFTLDAKEVHYALNVLRLQVDDEIWLLDGVGIAYRGIIKNNGQEVSGEIIADSPVFLEPKVKMHLAVGLINKDRFQLGSEKNHRIK